MSVEKLRWIGIAGLVGAVGLAVVMAGSIALIHVLNADFYGRLHEVETASGVGEPGQEGNPVAQVVLHQLLEKENAVETSLVLYAPHEFSSVPTNGTREFKVLVKDCGRLHGGTITRSVSLKINASQADNLPLTQESERFLLPTSSSVEGFPFDDVFIRPCVDFFRDGDSSLNFTLEVQRNFPGRLMSLSQDPIVDITLERPWIEKALVLSTSGAFVFLSGLLGLGLFLARQRLRTFDELLSVGGYIVAAAGFREVIGFSRTASTSALEVGVIGVPLFLLTFGVAVSTVRSIWEGEFGDLAEEDREESQ